MLERLQKILSARGIASRRKAEEYLRQGLVTVNGKVAELGQKADPDIDQIVVDGKVLEERQEMLYFLMHKPVGVVTTNIERLASSEFRVAGKKQNPTLETRHSKPTHTVRDLLPSELRGKIFPVGRLDKDSEGLLIFTNDGVLAYRLTHPKFDHEKEYEVTVANPIKDGQLQKLREGMTISGEKTKPTTVHRVSSTVFRITLTEGKNRQIRRMCQKVGDPVDRLQRVRIMTLTDAQLKPGDIRPLTPAEREALLLSLDMDPKVQKK